MQHVTTLFIAALSLWTLALAGSPVAPPRLTRLPDDSGYRAFLIAREIAVSLMNEGSRMIASRVPHIRKNGSVSLEQGTREFVRASRLLTCHRHGVVDAMCFNDTVRNNESVCR